MRIRLIIAGIYLFLSAYYGGGAFAQDLAFNTSVNAEKIQARVDNRIIKNIESYLNVFLNQTAWSRNTSSKFPIKGNLLLTLENVDNNIFSGFLIIQAERPVFNTSYSSPLFGFKDNDITFQFDLNQINSFNENTFINTNEPLRMNLPAILAFYAYMVLGYYHNSLVMYEGSPYFNKAFQIASNANSSAALSSGWKALTSNTNRFGIVKEMVSDNAKNLYVSSYDFFRKVLDNLYDAKEEAIKWLVQTLTLLKSISSENPSSVQVYLFLNLHREEILNIIRDIEDKKQKKDLLTLLNSI